MIQKLWNYNLPQLHRFELVYSYYKPQEVNRSIISWGVPEGLSPEITFEVADLILSQTCIPHAIGSTELFLAICLKNNESVPSLEVWPQFSSHFQWTASPHTSSIVA